jgi:hypothetical protein
MALPEVEIKQVMDEIVGSILGLRDLLQHDLPLAINLFGCEDRIEENVGEQLGRHLDVFTEYLGVIAGVLLAGESIEDTADCIDFLSYLGGGPPSGSLE